ncbi:MAG: hypothetical protein JNM96_02385, partial [Bacteroidia bacterium]|nr:hypothetical protein [Bacteroidia bacterium]
MRQLKNTNILFVFCLVGLFAKASGIQPSYGKPEKMTRFGIAPVIGFYSLNTKHAISPKSRMSFALFLKRERSMDKSYKAFISVGAEYFFHGLNFKSYYFSQDTLQLYDESFGYSYSMFVHELNVPVQAKFTFKSTNNSKFTPYFSLGYVPRLLLSANLSVSQDGNNVVSENVNLKFKNPLFYSKLNSYASLSFGIQSNRTRSESVTVFMELNYKYGFSPYY